MDSPAAPMKVVSSIAGALRSRPKVPSAMFSAGVFEAVVALAFLVANTPEGIFSSHHGKALVVVYYGIVTAGAIVGSATASASFYVAYDPEARHAIGMASGEADHKMTLAKLNLASPLGMALLCAGTLTLIPVIGLLVSFFMLRK